MKAIEIEITVLPDGSIQLPVHAGLRPGKHRAVLVVEEAAKATAKTIDLPPLPIIDVGTWPEGLSLRREDLYNDDGR